MAAVTREPALVHILEGDAAARAGLALLARVGGFAPRVLTSASELERTFPPRGCLVLDLLLPELAGASLVDVRQRYQIELPVIVMTVLFEHALAGSPRTAGARAVLVKPFGGAEFLRCIEEALAAADSGGVRGIAYPGTGNPL